jgi:iron complex outermembrane receptor protein
LISKYVSRQYLDNTENRKRSLDPFFTEELRASYSFRIFRSKKQLALIAQVANLFGEKYEPNGYTFSYISGGQTITENYYFPMAGTTFIFGLNLNL